MQMSPASCRFGDVGESAGRRFARQRGQLLAGRAQQAKWISGGDGKGLPRPTAITVQRRRAREARRVPPTRPPRPAPPPQRSGAGRRQSRQSPLPAKPPATPRATAASDQAQINRPAATPPPRAASGSGDKSTKAADRGRRLRHHGLRMGSGAVRRLLPRGRPPRRGLPPHRRSRVPPQPSPPAKRCRALANLIRQCPTG